MHRASPKAQFRWACGHVPGFRREGSGEEFMIGEGFTTTTWKSSCNHCSYHVFIRHEYTRTQKLEHCPVRSRGRILCETIINSGRSGAAKLANVSTEGSWTVHCFECCATGRPVEAWRSLSACSVPCSPLSYSAHCRRCECESSCTETQSGMKAAAKKLRSVLGLTVGNVIQDIPSQESWLSQRVNVSAQWHCYVAFFQKKFRAMFLPSNDIARLNCSAFCVTLLLFF